MFSLFAVITLSALCAAEPPAAGPKAATPLRDGVLYSTRGDNRVHAVSLPDLAPLGAIEAGLGAHELAISTDGRWAMGSAYGGPGKGHQPADRRLVVLDLAAGKVHRTIDLGELHRPNDIAFLPGSAEAVVTVEAPPRVVKVNADTGSFAAVTLEKNAGHMLALSPDGKRVYVSHVVPGSVTIVDVAEMKVTGNFKAPAGAEGIACSPDGKRLWIAANRSHTIAIVNTDTLETEASFECKGFPFRVKFSPDGRRVAVSCPMAGEIAVFDAADHARVARISTRQSPDDKQSPTSISFTPDGAAVVAVCDGPKPEIVLIDLAEGKVARRIASAGPTPDALTAGRMAWPVASPRKPAGDGR